MRRKKIPHPYHVIFKNFFCVLVLQSLNVVSLSDNTSICCHL